MTRLIDPGRFGTGARDGSSRREVASSLALAMEKIFVKKDTY